MMEAVKSGKESKVRRLISSGYHGNRLDASGRSSLHWAVEYGYTAVVELLIAQDWDLDLPDNKLQTPLHIACNFRRDEIATYLITAGCNVSIPDISGNRALHRAVHAGMESVVSLLCQSGADVNSTNNNGWTPIHEGVRIGNHYITRMLLRHGADANFVTQTNATPFLTAIFYYRIAHKNSYIGIESILQLLIEQGHCRLSCSDGQWTPLTACISIYNSYVAGHLLYHGCLIGRKTQYGRSLLVEAFSRCDTFVIRLLVLAGYQVSLDEVDQCARRIPTFSKAFLRLAYPGIDTNMGRVEIIRWLRERASQPFSLFELCRTNIRQTLNRACGDTSIVNRIPLLPLPPVIREYLALTDGPLEYLLLP